jgi:hypothetical protein
MKSKYKYKNIYLLHVKKYIKNNIHQSRQEKR